MRMEKKIHHIFVCDDEESVRGVLKEFFVAIGAQRQHAVAP